MTNEESLLYKKAHVELYEIIKNLSKKEKEKIPETFINNLSLNMDNNYVFEYDSSKNILEQNLMNETKALLVQMYIRYLAPEEDQELWERYNRNCLNKIEQEKSNKYSYDKLFANKKYISKTIEENVTPNMNLVEYKESLIKKILNKILSIFKK